MFSGFYYWIGNIMLVVKAREKVQGALPEWLRAVLLHRHPPTVVDLRVLLHNVGGKRLKRAQKEQIGLAKVESVRLSA